MADDVATLEAEAEAARQRLARTLDKLADPATHAAMKDEVVARVTGYKDHLIGSARGTGQSYADDLKARAMNNPAAVALIGAGIAYRLYRHPPVTTLLVGAGVALLARARGRTATDPTAYRAPYDPDQPRGYVPGGVAGYGYPVEEDAPGQTTTDRMVAAASQAGERAREIAGETRSRLSAAAEEAGSRISETAEQVRSAAQDTYEQARSTAQQTYRQVRATAQDTYEQARTTAQDAYGRTAAGAGDAYDRASDMFETVRRNPLALGLLGIAAGALAGRALRSTDTGDRFVRASGDALGRGARGVGSRTRYAAGRAADAASGLASTVSSAAGGVTSTVSSAASGVASSVTAAAAGVADTVGGLASSVTGGSHADDNGSPARGERASRGRRQPSGGRGRARGAGREDSDEGSGFVTSAAEAASAAYRGAAGQADYARRRTTDLATQVADQVS
ncbi:MAG TPA: hypothetical protein VF744_10000, partial [Beijerinckiaceae bacterium]